MAHNGYAGIGPHRPAHHAVGSVDRRVRDHVRGIGFDQLLLLMSLRQAERPATREHPFGHGQERYFWSLLAAFGIFVAGGGFSVFEGVLALTRNQQESPLIAYIAPVSDSLRSHWLVLSPWNLSGLWSQLSRRAVERRIPVTNVRDKGFVTLLHLPAGDTTLVAVKVTVCAAATVLGAV